MNYTNIIEELEKASLFDLHRLSAAINQKLDDPEKLQAIKIRLRPEQIITYFDINENRLIKASILKINRNTVLVRNAHDNKKWQIPLYYINLDNVDTDIQRSKQQQLKKEDLKVGDTVGFLDKNNCDITGNIIRLNSKSATIKTTQNTEWRVAYSLLHLIYDIDKSSNTTPLLGFKASEAIIDL